MRLIDLDKICGIDCDNCRNIFICNFCDAPVVEQSEDCIRREDAVRLAEQGQIQGYEWQFKQLSMLPPVVPQTKSGKWIEREDNTSFVHQIPRMWIECSCCGWSFDRGYKNRFLYCPKCGADMRESDKNAKLD